MNLMPDAVTVFIATVFNSYSITEMASRLDFLFKIKNPGVPNILLGFLL